MLCDKLDKSDMPFFLTQQPMGKWCGEIKYDGDRILLRFDAETGKTTLTTRSGKDATHRYPELHGLDYPVSVVLDGEMCVFDERGISLFNEGIAFRSHCNSDASIKGAMRDYPVSFVAFDVLEFNGVDLRDKPLRERRRWLEKLHASHEQVHVRISEHVTDYSGIVRLFDEVDKLGGEGVILKRLDSAYRWGKRSSAWLKVKNIKEVTLEFTKFEVNPKGITVENDDGIRVAVGGFQSVPVQQRIMREGAVSIEVNHLGRTKAGKFRQPTFRRIVGGD